MTGGRGLRQRAWHPSEIISVRWVHGSCGVPGSAPASQCRISGHHDDCSPPAAAAASLSLSRGPGSDPAFLDFGVWSVCFQPGLEISSSSTIQCRDRDRSIVGRPPDYDRIVCIAIHAPWSPFIRMRHPGLTNGIFRDFRIFSSHFPQLFRYFRTFSVHFPGLPRRAIQLGAPGPGLVRTGRHCMQSAR